METVPAVQILEDPAFDAAALNTPEISDFCSSSDWALTANALLHGNRREVIVVRPAEGHWMAFAGGPLWGYPWIWQPLELQWAFASPLLGPDSALLVDALSDFLRRQPEERRLAVLGGIPEDGQLYWQCVKRLNNRLHMLRMEGCHCLQTDLANGFDGFLGNRSGKFRATLRRSIREVAADGFVVDVVSSPYQPTVDAEALFARLLAVERRSWKWEQSESIFQSEAAAFYRSLIERCWDNGKLRVAFVHRDSEDVAYAAGCHFGNTFRGLQMSYDQRYNRFGLGNRCQLALIENAIAEGAHTYDLGMEIDYKKRWSDRQLRLALLLISPR